MRISDALKSSSSSVIHERGRMMEIVKDTSTIEHFCELTAYLQRKAYINK